MLSLCLLLAYWQVLPLGVALPGGGAADRSGGDTAGGGASGTDKSPLGGETGPLKSGTEQRRDDEGGVGGVGGGAGGGGEGDAVMGESGDGGAGTCAGRGAAAGGKQRALSGDTEAGEVHSHNRILNNYHPKPNTLPPELWALTNIQLARARSRGRG